jgi:hypothetical protein
MGVIALVRRLRHQALHGIANGHVVLFRIHVGSPALYRPVGDDIVRIGPTGAMQ